MKEMDYLNLALVQFDCLWKDPKGNHDLIEEMLLDTNAEVIVLPEMFTTGFIHDPRDISEPEGGETSQWMRKLSQDKSALIMGSIAVHVSDRYYNRMLMAFPDGSIQHYDKQHLFSFGGEDKFFDTNQDSPVVINFNSWRIRPFICYDLRFPVWCRNSRDSEYDLAVYVASWPAIRSYAWRQLLVARAIENQCYVMGVNRVGIDGAGIEYNGLSTIIDYIGLHLVETRDEGKIINKKILKSSLNNFRSKFPFLKDRDGFSFVEY